mmetsp:Transcript_21156/g.36079  ORF Transcript_21156/g.36079 Transcript_21156/m.36079 type:complete len:108 (+) Transcript_21156:151-474(+)
MVGFVVREHIIVKRTLIRRTSRILSIMSSISIVHIACWMVWYGMVRYVSVHLKTTSGRSLKRKAVRDGWSSEQSIKTKTHHHITCLYIDGLFSKNVMIRPKSDDGPR